MLVPTTFSAGVIRSDAAKDEFEGRRFRPYFFYCLNNCLWEFNAARDLDGWGGGNAKNATGEYGSWFCMSTIELRRTAAVDTESETRLAAAVAKPFTIPAATVSETGFISRTVPGSFTTWGLTPCALWAHFQRSEDRGRTTVNSFL
jgi:hypothetical protein